MSLAYYPSQGEILLCRYAPERDVFAGEMCKPRPIVVIGPRLRRRGKVVTIVPLSTTEPSPPENYHWKFEIARPLPFPFDNPVMWAKCDMVTSVALERLDRFKEPHSRYGGPRKWTSGKITPEQIKEIRAAILCGLGLPSLTIHL